MMEPYDAETLRRFDADPEYRRKMARENPNHDWMSREGRKLHGMSRLTDSEPYVVIRRGRKERGHSFWTIAVVEVCQRVGSQLLWNVVAQCGDYSSTKTQRVEMARQEAAKLGLPVVMTYPDYEEGGPRSYPTAIQHQGRYAHEPRHWPVHPLLHRAYREIFCEDP